MAESRPTPGERQFLRGIAAVNPLARRGEEDWWSAQDLRSTALFPDFRHRTVLSLAATGRACTVKGLAVSRQIGTSGHGWAEYRITGYGRGQVSDSCIGGGLRWTITGTAEAGTVRSIASACPACLATAAELGLSPVPETIPAHALPGHEYAGKGAS